MISRIVITSPGLGINITAFDNEPFKFLFDREQLDAFISGMFWLFKATHPASFPGMQILVIDSLGFSVEVWDEHPHLHTPRRVE